MRSPTTGANLSWRTTATIAEGRRRCPGVDPSLPSLAAPVAGQGRVSAEHREGSLEAPRVLPDNVGGATRTVSWEWSRVSPVINDADAIRVCSESRCVPGLYLLRRFREDLEHLKFQNHWKFLHKGLARRFESPFRLVWAQRKKRSAISRFGSCDYWSSAAAAFWRWLQATTSHEPTLATS
jgi:hypothetical protein